MPKLETRLLAIATVLGICLCLQGASAQTAACKSIEKESERLACYDRSASTAKTTGAAKARHHTPPPPELDELLDDVNKRLHGRTKAICRGC